MKELNVKSWIFLAVLFVGMAGCGDNSSSSSNAMALNGTWAFPPVALGGGVNEVMKLTFSNNQITNTNTCTLNSQAATVSVSSYATINDSSFVINQSEQNAVTQNGINCSVNLIAGTGNYSINGNTLTITVPGQSAQIIATKSQ